MKTILINLDSIKENPNVGSTTTRVATHWQCTFKTPLDMPEWMKENFDYAITSTQQSYDGVGNIYKIIEGEIYNQKLIPRLKKYFEKTTRNGSSGFELSETNRFQTINHPPISKYDYEYDKNQSLDCKDCGKSIVLNTVENDYTFNEDGDEHNFEVCNHCKEPHPFSEYEYETIEQALIRRDEQK